MSLIHLARQGFITKSALPSVTRTRGASYQPSLLLLGDGANNSTTIVDSSQNALTINRFGDTKISTTQKPTGMTSSIYFDGTGDYLSFADSFSFGSNNWTIEFWINFTSAPSAFSEYRLFYPLNHAAGFKRLATYVYASAISVGYAGVNIASSAALSWTTGQWYHLAFTRNGNTWNIWRDGVSVASATDSSVLVIDPTGYKVGENINGYISNQRVIVGTALYTKNFFVPTLPLSTFAQQKAYPDLLLLGSGTNGSTTITDSSPNAFTITRNGDTNISTAQYPVGMTSSIYFDGTGDYLSLPSSPISTTGDFTVEAWIYPTSDNDGPIAFYRGDATSSYAGFRLGYTTGSIYLLVSTSGSSWAINSGNFTATKNTWSHVAVVRRVGTFEIFVNGSSVYSSTAVGSGTALYNGSVNQIGRLTYISTNYDFQGYISNHRTVNGTALYTGKFNVPLLPLPSSSTSPGASPSLYITGDGINNSTNIIDRSPNAFTVTVNGDTKISTAQEPTGMVSSIYFDGTGDYLSVANNAAFDFGTGDFTVEAYVYIAGNSSLDGSNRRYANIFSLTTASTWPFGFAIQGNSTTTGTGLEIVNGSTAALVSTTIQQSTWNHIAVVRSGSSAYFFVNGVQAGATQSISGSWGSSTVAGQIGQTIYTSYNYPLNGYLSNIRITKGAALYTTTFVPPPLPILLNSNQIAYPSLLLRGAGANNSTTFTDSSPNAFTVTAFGNAKISTAQYPTGMSSSMYFDGTGDYLTTSYSSSFNFPGSFTIEFWAYPISRIVSYPTVFSNYSTYTTNGLIGIFCGHLSYSTKWSVSFNGVDGVLVSTTPIAYNAWVHIAIVRVNTAMTMYVNGVPESTSTQSATLAGTQNTIWIGAAGDAPTTTNFNGYLSNLRVVKDAALYRSDFTPPPLPASATPQTDLTPTTTASTVTNNVYGVYQLA